MVGLERNGDVVAKVTARFTDDACVPDGSPDEAPSVDSNKFYNRHIVI